MDKKLIDSMASSIPAALGLMQNSPRYGHRLYKRAFGYYKADGRLRHKLKHLFNG